MTTRATMLATCKTRFRDTTNAIYADAYWNERLQDGYQKVAGASPYWPFLQKRSTSLSITANTNSVALPTDFRVAETAFNDTDDIELEELAGRQQYRLLYPSGNATPGTPVHYRFQGATLEVFPTPTVTTTVALDYLAKPGTFSTGTDVPDWPEDWHNMLVEWALAHAYLDDGNYDQYKVHMGVFEEQLQEMKGALTGGRGDHYPQIQDAWDD